MFRCGQLAALGLAAIALALSYGTSHPQTGRQSTCANNQSPCPSAIIVHNAWHAAIVLRKSDLTEKTMPELADFPTAQFIEFSWGDKDYFPNPDSGVAAAIKAALWSGGSVIHLVGLTDSIENFYRGATTTELRLNPGAYERLVAYLNETFVREQPESRARAAPGLFPYSRFYPSGRSFSLLRTCNTWVAEALAQAGLPISSGIVITAANLQSQLSAIKAMP